MSRCRYKLFGERNDEAIALESRFPWAKYGFDLHVQVAPILKKHSHGCSDIEVNYPYRGDIITPFDGMLAELGNVLKVRVICKLLWDPKAYEIYRADLFNPWRGDHGWLNMIPICNSRTGISRYSYEETISQLIHDYTEIVRRYWNLSRQNTLHRTEVLNPNIDVHEILSTQEGIARFLSKYDIRLPEGYWGGERISAGYPWNVSISRN